MPGNYEAVVSLLVSQFEVHPDAASPEKTLEQLGVDSLAAVELAAAMDAEWGVRVEDSGIDRKMTLREVADLVTEKAAAPPVKDS